jgi:hypothetical protein
MQALVGARRVELRQVGAWSALRARVNRLHLRSLEGVRLMVHVAHYEREGHRTHMLQAPSPIQLPLRQRHDNARRRSPAIPGFACPHLGCRLSLPGPVGVAEGHRAGGDGSESLGHDGDQSPCPSWAPLAICLGWRWEL